MEDTQGKIAPGVTVSLSVLGSTLFLGAMVLAISYIVRRLSRCNESADTTKHATESEKVKFAEHRWDRTGATTATNGRGTGGSKRAKNKKRREAQQEFTHSWIVGALKGHTAPILDMSFSSNGKYLASCAEDCGLRPEEEMAKPGVREVPTSSANSMPRRRSMSAASNGAGSTCATGTEDRASLSRRQKKNRTRTPREHCGESVVYQPTEERRYSQTRYKNASSAPGGVGAYGIVDAAYGTTSWTVPVARNGFVTNGDGAGPKAWRTRGYFVSCQRKQLGHLSDGALAGLLRRYTLNCELMAHLGYPMECGYFPGYAVINYHQHPMGHRSRAKQHLDVNAREFVPSGVPVATAAESEGDSGRCSGSSLEGSDQEQESASDSEKSSGIGESSSSAESSASSSCYQERPRRDSSPEFREPPVAERRCSRCFRNFYTNRDTGEYINQEPCLHHWGKLRNGVAAGVHGDVWECCGGRESAAGCTTAGMHVWTGLTPGCNGPLDGYVRTRPAGVIPLDGNYGIYAVDCEMCFTKRGLELAKVTVVGVDGNIVYETLVIPDVEVIDYNTRFSGITAEDLSTATKTLREVQEDLTSFIFAETILIGHGLENDLRALKLLHNTVIDTCVAFPHYLGIPYRRSLKMLARTVLRREIQVSEHDSAEDARIAVDLMLLKLQHDLL